jgi:hypothetical protein
MAYNYHGKTDLNHRGKALHQCTAMTQHLTARLKHSDRTLAYQGTV